MPVKTGRAINDLFSEPVPLTTLIEVTHDCNFDCIHCYLCGSRTPNRSLDRADIVQVLDGIRALGGMNLLLTGGEPTLSERLGFWLAEAVRREFAIDICTNASMISEGMLQDWCKAKPYLRGLNVSIYGCSSRTYESITGRTSTWESVQRGLRACVAAGIPVSAQVPVMRLNVREMAGIREWCASLGITARFGLTVTPRTDGSTEPLSERLTDDEMRYAVAIDERERAGTDAARVIGMCSAGSMTCGIAPDGEMLPCLAWREPCGNVVDTSFVDVWNNSPVLNSLRDLRLRFEECEQCQDRGYCKRNCPGLARLEHGSFQHPAKELCRKTHIRASVGRMRNPPLTDAYSHDPWLAGKGDWAQTDSGCPPTVRGPLGGCNVIVRSKVPEISIALATLWPWEPTTHEDATTLQIEIDTFDHGAPTWTIPKAANEERRGEGVIAYTSPDGQEWIAFEERTYLHLVPAENRLAAWVRRDKEPIAHTDLKYLLGEVLTWLAMHGHAHMHASAALVNGHAVTFLGHSGYGKSTLALAAGCLVGDWVSDDVCLVVDHGSSGAWIHPFSGIARPSDCTLSMFPELRQAVVPPQRFGEYAEPVMRILQNVTSDSEVENFAIQPASRMAGHGVPAEYLLFPRRTSKTTPELKEIDKTSAFLSVMRGVCGSRSHRLDSRVFGTVSALVKQCHVLDMEVPAGVEGIRAAMQMLADAVQRSQLLLPMPCK